MKLTLTKSSFSTDNDYEENKQKLKDRLIELVEEHYSKKLNDDMKTGDEFKFTVVFEVDNI
jgi:hypothetical protein